MSTASQTEYFDAVSAGLGHRYHLERMVATSTERVLFMAVDRVLHRRVSLRAQIDPGSATRSWFMREAETLARLDHPAIRHVYDAGVVGSLAYRVGNWIDGESLEDAVARSPRPIPAVHGFARDVLSAMQHAHERGMVVRRIAPDAVLTNSVGRSTITDMRFAGPNIDAIPAGLTPSDLEFMAPETRQGDLGDTASDVYSAGAVLYYAVTGVRPPLDTRELVPPTELRPVCPQVIERILVRAMQYAPEDRFFSTGEMLEHFAAEAGAFDPAWTGSSQSSEVAAIEDPTVWERRLRRALGDDYELLNLLGAGGFGRVYRVRDLHLEREVALKVLHPSLTTDPSGVERFRREAQLAAGIHHPNVVNIFDIASRAGLLWYTMEMVNGPNLAQLVEHEGPLPLDVVLRLLREALAALSHAHNGGLVHRDIKPENLLQETDGSFRITDFGLALALRGEGGFGGATSRSGTPQFASPEQLLGEHVDQRTDIYSIAAVAYYALLGVAPFAGATPEQVLAKQTNNMIPSLSPDRPDVSRGLERALHRALLSDPAQRYPSAAEFYQAIHQATAAQKKRPVEWPAVPTWLRRSNS